MYLKFSAHAYFRTRNSNLKSVSNKNQLEISRNLIRNNRISPAPGLQWQNYLELTGERAKGENLVPLNNQCSGQVGLVNFGQQQSYKKENLAGSLVLAANLCPWIKKYRVGVRLMVSG